MPTNPFLGHFRVSAPLLNLFLTSATPLWIYRCSLVAVFPFPSNIVSPMWVPQRIPPSVLPIFLSCLGKDTSPILSCTTSWTPPLFLESSLPSEHSRGLPRWSPEISVPRLQLGRVPGLKWTKPKPKTTDFWALNPLELKSPTKFLIHPQLFNLSIPNKSALITY